MIVTETVMRDYKDYYAILNVEEDVFPSQVKNAYLSIAKRYHPDNDKSAEARERFALANEAYMVLVNPFARKKYDQLYEYYKHSESEAFLEEKKKRRIEAVVDRRAAKGEKKAVARENQSWESIDAFFKSIGFLFKLLDVVFSIIGFFVHDG